MQDPKSRVEVEEAAPRRTESERTARAEAARLVADELSRIERVANDAARRLRAFELRGRSADELTRQVEAELAAARGETAQPAGAGGAAGGDTAGSELCARAGCGHELRAHRGFGSCWLASCSCHAFAAAPVLVGAVTCPGCERKGVGIPTAVPRDLVGREYVCLRCGTSFDSSGRELGPFESAHKRGLEPVRGGAVSAVSVTAPPNGGSVGADSKAASSDADEKHGGPAPLPPIPLLPEHEHPDGLNECRWCDVAFRVGEELDRIAYCVEQGWRRAALELLGRLGATADVPDAIHNALEHREDELADAEVSDA